MSEHDIILEHLSQHCVAVSHVTKEDNEEKWLQVRRMGIGGSDIGSICNENPWSSARQVYLSKTGQMPEDMETKMNDRMHFGNVLEPIVASEYARRSGNRVYDPKTTYASIVAPFALANPDRFIYSDVKGFGILECKTADKFFESYWNEGAPPIYYIMQLQWYMYVTGAQWGALACLCGGNSYYCLEMPRNEEMISMMLLKGEYFWKENVLKLVEPELSASLFDTELVKKKVERGTDEVLENPLLDTLAEELLQLRVSEKNIKNEIEAHKNKIKEILGTVEYGVTERFLFKQLTICRNGVDAKLLQQAFPNIYEAVKTQSEYVKLDIV